MQRRQDCIYLLYEGLHPFAKAPNGNWVWWGDAWIRQEVPGDNSARVTEDSDWQSTSGSLPDLPPEAFKAFA
jgi:hypothetical protein